MSKHSHYHKDVAHLKTIDVYRLLELFGVTDQALGHVIKKLLCAGQRGAGKTFEQDVREAVDTLNRRLQMLVEDGNRTDEFGERAVPTGPQLHRAYEHEATHRDGGGAKYKQDGKGRWLRWGNGDWFTFSADPKAVPEHLQALPAYDGHD